MIGHVYDTGCKIPQGSRPESIEDHFQKDALLGQKATLKLWYVASIPGQIRKNEHLKVWYIWHIKFKKQIMFSYIFYSHNLNRPFLEWIFIFLPALGEYSLMKQDLFENSLLKILVQLHARRQLTKSFWLTAVNCQSITFLLVVCRKISISKVGGGGRFQVKKSFRKLETFVKWQFYWVCEHNLHCKSDKLYEYG